MDLYENKDLPGSAEHQAPGVPETTGAIASRVGQVAHLAGGSTPPRLSEELGALAAQFGERRVTLGEVPARLAHGLHRPLGFLAAFGQM